MQVLDTGFQGGASGKEPTPPARQIEEMKIWSLVWEDILEEGTIFTQYSYLENLMDRGAWQATVMGCTGLDTIEVIW